MASKKPKKANDRIEVFKNDTPKLRKNSNDPGPNKNQYNWHRIKGQKKLNVRYSGHGYDTMQSARKEAVNHADRELATTLPVYQINPDGTFKQV